MEALARRDGVEGFFMIVRNRADPFMAPYWWFTNEKLESYMPFAIRGGWDTEKVGARCEAFAVAGLEIANLAKTSRDKAILLRAEIRMILRRMLAEILGIATPKMEFKQFDHLITRRFGVVLEGWPLPKFANPSELGSALEPLGKLKDALVDGTCRFRKLSDAEYTKWLNDHEQDARPGRKQRSDAGVARGPRKKATKQPDDDEEDGEDDGEEQGDDANEIDLGFEAGGDEEDDAVTIAMSKVGKSKSKSKAEKSKSKAETSKTTSKDVKKKEAKAKEAKEKAAKKASTSRTDAHVESGVPGAGKKRKGKAVERDNDDVPGAIVAVRSPPPPNHPRPQKKVPARSATPQPSDPTSSRAPATQLLPPTPDPPNPQPPTSDPSSTAQTSDENAMEVEPAGLVAPTEEISPELQEWRATAANLKRKMNGLDGRDIIDGKRSRKPKSFAGGADFAD
ncbi:hypothetical protein V5O48_010089 [Marasmius crinis-equi]|uniref:Uncharacterized protein n=1 Tax=Marasmius crinis-equi TaxID=585013 RepID=A0ABR3F9C5_9AGAR